MPKVYYCSKCDLQHPWPVGKKYKLEGESLAGDVEVPAPPSLRFLTRYWYGRQDGFYGQTGAEDCSNAGSGILTGKFCY